MNLGMNWTSQRMLKGKEALCGSFDEDEELDYEEHVRDENSEIEEGEVPTDSDEEESEEELEDEEVAQCIRSRNLDRLKKILKKRENDCKQLKKEMEKEKLREKQKHEMQELVSKIGKVTKTKCTIQRSLASSKQNSPSHSPKVQKYRVKGKPPDKKDVRVVQQKEKPREEGSEYNDLLSTMLKLKQGSTDYNEIVANAMNAMDNLLTLSDKHNKVERNCAGVKADMIVEGKVGHRGNARTKASGTRVNSGEKGTSSANNHETGANAIFDIIDKFVNKDSGSMPTANDGMAMSLLAALSDNANSFNTSNPSPESPEKTVKLLNAIKGCLGGYKGEVKKNINKKLVSGKCAKPEESDIKLVVPP